MRFLALLILAALCSLTVAAQSNIGYYRFPAMTGNEIVFTAEGDLWKVNQAGGQAQRLTSHPGAETQAAISPDGKWVAFSGQYEGPTEVYVMPLAGGLPKRLTYDGSRTSVMGWTPDGKVLYRTQRFSTLPDQQLVVVDPQTLVQKVIPLSQASDGCYDATGKTLFFTRLPFQGSATKRYKGGSVEKLWKFVDGATEAVPLTADFDGTSRDPMWWNGRLYFVSDRDGILNLWSMKDDGSDLKQHTFHKEWDVKSPALNNGNVVYQLGADLHVFDLAAGKDREVAITLSSDFDQMRERWIKKPMDYLTAAHLSPKGDKVVATIRGRVYVLPAEPGRIVEATRQEGVRYLNARFAGDANSVIALSDQTGEFEFWKIPANGVGEPTNLTRDGKIFRFDGVPSPDGKWIAYTDKNNQIWAVDVEKKVSKLIATSGTGGLGDLNWSPDSQWLAYSRAAENTISQIWLYRPADGTSTAITSDRVESYSPAWSPDGKWLYFLSDRSFVSSVGSPWGPRAPEPFFDKPTKIFQIALTKGLRSNFKPADEVSAAAESVKDEKKTDDAAKKDGEKKSTPVMIDLEGIQDRVYELPLSAGNYGGLSASDKFLFFLDYDASPDPKRRLQAVEIKTRDVEAKTVSNDVNYFELSQDGKKLLVWLDSGMFVFDAGSEAPKDLGKVKIPVESLVVHLDPREEWRQMFVDSWRLMRDYFYDPGMHKVDWPGMLKKYQPLVARVTDRSELSDLMFEMVGELSTLHTFVRDGDPRQSPDQIAGGSLGAILERDEKGGGFRIAHIFQGEPDYLEKYSPLKRPDLTINEGDIIESVNGVATLSVPHIGALLRNQAGKDVLLRVKAASTGKSFDAVVKPISQNAEANLRYDEWEYRRRKMVDELSQGQIGYIHLRAMGSDNMAEWVKNYFPIFNRKGLIVDVRHNRGGNIDSWILGRLLRKAWFNWQPRTGDTYHNMQYAFRGHLVVLCDEATASDGEAFAEGFRRLGLGKVIGTRTWGGEVWLTSSNVLVDNGIASAAEFGVFGPEGDWLIEGVGVVPDETVDNLPHATFKGQDTQLEAAIKHLQELIRTKPVNVLPKHPAYPDKSFRRK